MWLLPAKKAGAVAKLAHKEGDRSRVWLRRQRRERQAERIRGTVTAPNRFERRAFHKGQLRLYERTQGKEFFQTRLYDGLRRIFIVPQKAVYLCTGGPLICVDSQEYADGCKLGFK